MNAPRLSMREFVEIARRVMDELDDPFRRWLENIVVDVEPEPSAELLEELEMDPEEDTLLGLFEGHAVTEQEYGDHLPNRILLFKRPIEDVCRSRAEVAFEIRRTLIHELAHHFGYSEEDLEEYESRPSPFDAERPGQPDAQEE
jgi:predicted Zn-dependent protease with MMP-like domain